MLTKMPILFILSLIIIFSICQECPTSDSSINYDNCFSFLLPNKYCCFFAKNGTCISIEKGKLKSSSSNNVICQFSEENFGKYEFEKYRPKLDFDSNIGLMLT